MSSGMSTGKTRESMVSEHTQHSLVTAAGDQTVIFPLLSVRQKAKEIIAFLQDDERLKDARKQAKQTRDKYVGYSSEEAQYRYSKSLPL